MSVQSILGAIKTIHGLPRQGRKSTVSSMIDMLGLRAGPFRLIPSDYVDFGLYQNGWTHRQRSEFVSEWARENIYRSTDHATIDFVESKILTCDFMFNNKLPAPRMLAIAGHGRSSSQPSVVSINDAAGLSSFLEFCEDYPLFIKPDIGAHGWSSYFLKHVDKTSGLITLGSGETMQMDRFTQVVFAKPRAFVVQTSIAPHSDIARVTGGKLASNRLVVLLSGQDVVFHRAVIRIPLGTSMIDNFDGGRTGNVAGEVDVSSGKVVRVIKGVGPALRTIDTHPDTGASFEGWTMPHWQLCLDTVARAARLFPGLPIQAWDFGITETGPELLEVNPRGQLKMVQLASQRGFADDVLKAHLRRIGGGG